MEWGSSFVYDYLHSSEEELSDGELEEGMWLSDSEGEDDVPPPPPGTTTSSKPGFFGRFFRRAQTTKRPPNIPDSDSSSDEETNEIQDQSTELSRHSGYVDLTLPSSETSELKVQVTPPRDNITEMSTGATTGTEKNDDKEEEFEGSPVKYAQLAEFQKQIRDQMMEDKPHQLTEVQKLSNPNPIVKNEDDDIVDQRSYTEPTRAPPLPPPLVPIKQLHGIMKGGIKKQRKNRVRWNESYKKKRKDDSHGVRTRRTDTNILAVKFNTLAEAGNFHTGDAEFCSNPECGAIVSHLTKLEGDDDKKIWTCEFCGTNKEVELVPEEIPTMNDTTYLLTAAAAVQSEGGGGPLGDESLVVFCIDISGSMCVTTEVPGQHDLRGAKEKKEKLLQSLPTDLDIDVRRAELQYMQGQRRNVTWISRMESVQAAVDAQLSRLVHSEPNKRVCLVAFSDDVVIIGDGRMVPVTMAGDKLSNSQTIVDTGREIPLPAAIKETQKALSKKVFSIEESGQTALGPAVLVSIVIASQKPGSKVIVCTDGLANVGLGGLDVTSNDKAYAAAVNFYDDLGDIALEKGVTVSLLKIQGGDCRAVELGQMANRTGGQVTPVNPLTVTEEFGSILTNPVIATDVISKIILHKELYIRTEDSRESVIVKQVGNVTADSELTYEYGMHRSKKPPKAPTPTDGDEVKSKGATGGASPGITKVPPLIIDGQDHVAFQLQIEYTSLDGDKCLRVITQTKPVTSDRSVAEKDMDIGVIGSHVAKQTAELTMQGEFTKARVKSLSAQKMLHEQSRSSDSRRWEYTNYCSNMIPLENELHVMQQSEPTSYGRNLSDDEGEEERYETGSELMGMSFAARRKFPISMSPPMAPSRPLPKMRKSKEVSRRKDMSDDLAVGIYGLKSTSSDMFRSPTSSTEAYQPRKKPPPYQPPKKDTKPPPQKPKTDKSDKRDEKDK